MTGRHRNWHRAWRRDGQSLVHASGLVMQPLPAPDAEGCRYAPALDSLRAWEAHERARGVRADQLDGRLSRLLAEAEMWEGRA